MTDKPSSPDQLSPDERLARAFDSLDDADVRLEDPPAEVWQAIVDEIADEPDAPEAPDATVKALGRRVVSIRTLTIAAGVALLAVAALSSPFIANRSSNSAQLMGDTEPKPPADTAIAVADLEALEDGVQAATAELLDNRTMILLPDLAVQESGYYEVWLLDATAQQLLSLGPLREDGRYTVPLGVSVEDFPIVDISIEAADGNPGHSGRSVLRGTLA